MTRNASFDLVRLLAAFGIVLFHSGAPGAAWGYAGLPFFLLLMGLFAVPLAERIPTAEFARNRARRLLVPWLVWSAIYAALGVAQAVANGRPALGWLEPWMWFTGTALHLWFLPFAFVLGCALHALARAVRRGGTRQLDLLGWAAAAVAFAALGLSQAGPWPGLLAQWLFAIPSLMLGLHLSSGRPVLRITGVVLVVAGAWALGWTQDLLPLTVALMAVALCLAVRVPDSPRTRALAEVALIVYLCHPLAAFLLFYALPLTPASTTSAVLTMALSLAIALSWPLVTALPRLAAKRVGLT